MKVPEFWTEYKSRPQSCTGAGQRWRREWHEFPKRFPQGFRMNFRMNSCMDSGMDFRARIPHKCPHEFHMRNPNTTLLVITYICHGSVPILAIVLESPVLCNLRHSRVHLSELRLAQVCACCAMLCCVARFAQQACSPRR